MHVEGGKTTKKASLSKQRKKKKNTYNTQCNKLKMSFKWQHALFYYFFKKDDNTGFEGARN